MASQNLKANKKKAMAANIDKIKELRAITGLSVMQCKKALEEADYDIGRAKVVLESKIGTISGAKAQRITKEGIVTAYIHPTRKMGVLLDIACESDFVAKSENFQTLAHEICLQIAAMDPFFVKEEDIPEEFLSEREEIFRKQIASGLKKPAKIADMAVKNKLKKYKEDISLLSQTWIKDESKKIKDLIEEQIAKFGENIVVKRFVRYSI